MSVTTSSTSLNDVDIASVAALASAITDDPAKAATRWRASVTWRGGFRSEAAVRDFEPIASDEPTGLGGTDTAPNPVEQVLAALGSCLAVGYAANATARGIVLDSLRIDVSGPVDLHSFLGLRPGHAGFDRIDAVVHLSSPASSEDIDALHEHVLSTSPVGHTLQTALPVSISLAD
jgi:uncharacterized OsmC-like protein